MFELQLRPLFFVCVIQVPEMVCPTPKKNSDFFCTNTWYSLLKPPQLVLSPGKAKRLSTGFPKEQNLTVHEQIVRNNFSDVLGLTVLVGVFTGRKPAFNTHKTSFLKIGAKALCQFSL